MKGEEPDQLLWTEEALEAEQVLREFPTAAKVHSARYLKERNPKLYLSIRLGLKYGIPVSVSARELGVSENTIRAVAFAEHSSVEDSKEALKESMRRFVHGGVHVLLENLDKIPVEKLAVAIGIINQNLLLLEGQATQIVQHQRQETSIEDMARLIEAAQRKAHGHVVDAEEIGSEAGNESANGTGAGGARAADGGPPALAEGAPDLGQMARPSGWEAAVKQP